MLKMLKALMGALRTSDKAPARPPVDLNKPVENPALVQALERVAGDDSDDAKDALVRELQRANYLAAIIADEMKTTSPEPGMTTIKAGSVIKFVTCEKDGQHFLPLFSDWAAIRAYTDQNVSTLVLPASEAWSFALDDDAYQGIVINPAHNALPLELPMVRYLAGQAT